MSVCHDVTLILNYWSDKSKACAIHGLSCSGVFPYPFEFRILNLLEHFLHGLLSIGGPGQLIAIKVFRTYCGHLAIKFRNGADPGSRRKFACGAPDEFYMRPTHVPRVMNDFSFFDHHEDGI